MLEDSVLEDDLNIALVTDRKFLFPACVTIQSVLDHLDYGKVVNFYILHLDIPLEIQNLLSASLEDGRCTIYFLDCSSMLDAYPEYKKFGHAPLFRSLMVFAPTLLKNISQLILMEGDMLVQKDISELAPLSLGHPISAVSCMWALSRGVDGNYQRFGFDQSTYFNGGLKILNNHLVTDEERQALITLGQENIQPYDELVFNRVFRQMNPLPLAWNSQIEVLLDKPHAPHPSLEQEWNEARNNPAICHFMASSKPWGKNAVPFYNEYLGAWRQLQKKVKGKVFPVLFPDLFN